MNKAQLITELNQFSKEEIIEAIADTDNILANRIKAKLYRQKNAKYVKKPYGIIFLK